MLAATMAVITGCGSEEEEAPPAVVKTVAAYGLTLDDTATPKQVAYVLLRSMADDVQAAQAHDKARQKAALKITYSLAAYSTIEERLGMAAKEEQISARPQEKDRNKRLYEFTRDWAPIVAHYIRSFDTTFEAASRRMTEVISRTNPPTAHVYYEVSHDPNEANPAKQETATLDIELVKEQGGVLSYWRVARVGFRTPMARTRPATISIPASGPHE
jgi:hypothetical protein